MAWGFYRPITVDRTKAGATTSNTNFPFPVAGTYVSLKTVANGGKVQSASGFDIAFFSDTGLTTMLNFERIAWDGTSGAVEFYVQATINGSSAGSDTVIYMAYGNTAITTDQQNANATWDANYLLVSHMKDITTSTVADSTSGGFTGTKGSAGHPSEGTGVVGKGQDFVTDDLDFGTSDTFNLTNNITWEIWCKLSNTNAKYAFTRRGGAGDQWAFIYGFVANKYEIYSDRTALRTALTTAVSDTTTFHHIVWTYTTTQLLGYLDGALDTTNNAPASITSSSLYDFHLGHSAASNDFYAGSQDEVRISNIVRPAAWIAATFNSMNSPSTFYTVGNEVTVSTGSPPASTFSLLGVG